MTGPTPAPRPLLLLALLALAASACGGGGGGGAGLPPAVDAARSSLAAAPAQAVADGAATVTLTATARDAAGAPVAGRAAAFTVSGAGNALSAAQATTGADGTASVTVRSTRAEAKTARVTIDGTLVTQAAALGFVAGPPSAATSTLAVAGAPAVADGVASATVTVAVQDASGNPVSGAIVDLAVAGATPSSPQVTTGADGAASATLTSATAGTATVSASVGGVALAGPADVAFVAGPAASLVLAAQPTGGTAGAALAALTVTARDATGNAAPLPGAATVALLTAPAGAALAGTASAPAGASATFADLSVERAGDYVLRVASGGLQLDSAAFTVAPAAPSAATSTVAATPPTATAGAAVALTATVRDAFGNPVPGVAVTFTASGAANALTQPAGATDAAGQASGALTSTLAETKTVSASTGGTAAVTFEAGPASAATSALSVAGSPATADGIASVTVTAALRDQHGNPVAGAAVGFSATGATLSAAQATTGADGRASVAATSTVAGAASVSASAGAVALGPQPLAFAAGPAASLVLTAEPSGGIAGGVIAAIVVAARDTTGNATALPGAATVSLLTAPAGAVLSGTTTQAGASSASFAGLSVQRSGSYRLRVTSGALAVDGAAFTVAPAAAAALTVTAAPAGPVTAGAPFGVTVELRDAFGNLTGSTAAVSLGAGAASLTGITTVAAAAGVATFAGLAVEQVAAGVELTATSAGLTPATADRFDVVAGPAASLVLAAQPAAGTAGEPLAPLTVTARDAFANAAALPGAATVSLLAGPAGAALGGTTTQAGASSASFADLSLQRSGSYRLRVTSGALAVDGGAFTVAPAPSAALAFTASPATPVAAGAPFTAAVELRDAFGNVAASSATVALSLGAPGTLAGTAAVPASAGVAAFAGLSVDQAGANTLVASAAGLPSASVPLDVVAGPAAALVFTVQPSGGGAGEPFSPPVEVSLRDAFGNPADDDGVAVSLALLGGPGGGALLGTPAAVTVGGRVAFADLAVDRAGGGYGLRASAVGLASSDSAAFAIRSAPVDPATSTVVASAATATAGGAVTLTATALDFFGNPVSGAVITLAATGGDNALTQPGAATDAAGQAAGALSSTRAEAKTVSASAGGASFGATASVTFQPGAPATLTSTLSAAPSAGVLADGVAAATVTATVRDQHGNPVPGVTVTLAASGGGNTLVQPAGPTSAAGVAAGSLASTTAGTKSVTASAGATALGVAQAVTFDPGPAASLLLVAQPVAGTAGATLAALTVAARDAFANATALPGAATVALLAAPPGAVLGGTTSASGTTSATFGDLVVVRAGAYLLRVSSGGLSVDGGAFTVDPAAAAALAFSTPPAGPVTAGAPFGATIEVRDAFDNVAASGALVSLALGTPGTLSGTASRAAAAGVAAFSGLSIDRAGPASLSATSAGLIGASTTFEVLPGPAAALAFTVQPTSIAAGDLFAPPVAVALRDAFGNAVSTDGLPVTLELLGGASGATLLGDGSGLTVGGEVTFADLSVDLAGAGYTLRARSGGALEGTSAAFAVTHAAADPATSGVAAAPASATVGDPVALTATVRDFFGNPVPGATVTFAATGSGNTLTQPAAATDASGQATGALSSTRAEAKTVSGSLGGAAFAGTATVTFAPGAPSAATSTLAASPASVLADGTTIALTATLLDQHSNPIPGLAVTFAADGPASFVQPGAVTSAAGVATGAVSSLTAGVRHLSALVGGLALAGVDVTFESTDRDGDGIPNGEDAFPDDAARFDTFATVLLERLGGGLFGAAVAINDLDLVAGYGDDGAGATSALAWAVTGLSASPAITLLPIPGNASSAAYGVGPTGAVVGESEKGADTVAVVWPAGSALPVELSLAGVAPPAAALGTGGSLIVGEAALAGQRRGVLWPAAGAAPVVLATLGGPSGAAYAVSAAGLVVGEAETGAGLTRGAVWRLDAGGAPGPAVALPPLPGHVRSTALAVSAAGVVVGESESAAGLVHAVRWVLDGTGAPGPAADLGPGSAAAVNATRLAGTLGDPAQAVTLDLRNLALSEALTAGAAEPSRALGMNAAHKTVGLVGTQGFVAIP